MKVPKLSIDQISIINTILDKVKTHPQYNKSIEEAAGFYPPYIEKSVVFPELSKKKSGYDLDKQK